MKDKTRIVRVAMQKKKTEEYCGIDTYILISSIRYYIFFFYFATIVDC